MITCRLYRLKRAQRATDVSKSADDVTASYTMMLSEFFKSSFLR